MRIVAVRTRGTYLEQVWLMICVATAIVRIAAMWWRATPFFKFVHPISDAGSRRQYQDTRNFAIFVLFPHCNEGANGGNSLNRLPQTLRSRTRRILTRIRRSLTVNEPTRTHPYSRPAYSRPLSLYSLHASTKILRRSPAILQITVGIERMTFTKITMGTGPKHHHQHF